MESWVDRLGMEGLLLISLGICGTMAALSTDSRDVLKEPVEKKSWHLVEFDELVQMLRANSIQLFDVREPSETSKGTTVIPHSINIRVGDIKEAFKMPASAFESKYGVKQPNKDDMNIVTYCKAGMRSNQAMEKLHALGYIYARTYKGSFDEYSTLSPRKCIIPTLGKRKPTETKEHFSYTNSMNSEVSLARDPEIECNSDSDESRTLSEDEPEE